MIDIFFKFATMTRHYLFGILMLLTYTILEVYSLPTNSETTTSVEELTESPENRDEKSLAYDETNIENEDTAREIIKKITAINEALKKPNRRYPIAWNPSPPPISSSNILDQDILEKLQQVIASGKLHSYSHNIKQQDTNTLRSYITDVPETMRLSKQISPIFSGNTIAPIPMAYMMNMPVLVMPNTNNLYGLRNSIDFASQKQAKEEPTFSFQPFQYFPQLISQLQTPLAPFFPIILRDPFISAVSGTNFVEYGQSADICKRKQNGRNGNELTENDDLEIIRKLSTSSKRGKSREKRAIKKRTVNHRSQLQEVKNSKVKKFFSLASTTVKPSKQDSTKIIKTTKENEGDLRFPFLFAQKDKPPNGPGFFINRLKVRKGGVAIAGPGGVATAGRGGTAIVGPGGLAYTQPGGMAVAGPAARIIALSSDADLTSVANRLQQQSTVDGSTVDYNGNMTEKEAKMNTANNKTRTDTME